MDRDHELLDRCVDRLLVGGDAEGLLAPESTDLALALEPLLRTSALVTRQLSGVEPSDEFRQVSARRARNLFLARLSQKDSHPGSLTVWWQRRWVTAMATSVVVCLAGLGMLAASVNALPTGFFYPVKTATEQAQLMLTTSPVDRAELQLEYASRRLDEMTSMAQRGDFDTAVFLAGESARLVGQVCSSSLFGLPSPDAAGVPSLDVYTPGSGPSAAQALSEERESTMELLECALQSAPGELEPDIRALMEELGREFDSTIALLETTTAG
jgi:hypothetical protein